MFTDAKRIWLVAVLLTVLLCSRLEAETPALLRADGSVVVRPRLHRCFHDDIFPAVDLAAFSVNTDEMMVGSEIIHMLRGGRRRLAHVTKRQFHAGRAAPAVCARYVILGGVGPDTGVFLRLDRIKISKPRYKRFGVGGPEDGQVRRLALSPNARLLAVVFDRRLVVATVATGKVILKTKAPFANVVTHRGIVAFSDDNRFVANVTDETARRRSQVLTVWDLETQHRVAEIIDVHPHPDCGAIAFSNDRSVLCVGQIGRIRVFDVQNGKQIHTLDGMRNVTEIFFTENDERIVIADAGNREIKTYDTKSGKLVGRLVLSGFRPHVGMTLTQNALKFVSKQTQVLASDSILGARGGPLVWDLTERAKKIDPRAIREWKDGQTSILAAFVRTTERPFANRNPFAGFPEEGDHIHKVVLKDNERNEIEVSFADLSIEDQVEAVYRADLVKLMSK